MSPENVEVVRQVYDSVARRDTAAVLARYAADVEWDFSRGGLGGLVGPGVYRGHEGLRRWFREWYDAWENLEDNCERLIDAGHHVISLSTVGGGRASGLEVELSGQLGVWTIRDGKVVRVVWFGPPDLEATGRPEWAMSQGDVELQSPLVRGGAGRHPQRARRDGPVRGRARRRLRASDRNQRGRPSRRVERAESALRVRAAGTRADQMTTSTTLG